MRVRIFEIADYFIWFGFSSLAPVFIRVYRGALLISSYPLGIETLP